jgi:SNF2 family DNA or RNA helicase
VNPNKKLVNVMNILNEEMREVVEMINADAIETAAERLGIKTTTPAGIFEKILGDQYDTMLFVCKILEFISQQRQNANLREPWLGEDIHGGYGVRNLQKFEEIKYEYPDIDKFLIEQNTKYMDKKNKSMTMLTRIKDHIMEGECPVCMLELKDDCDGKILIFKCCSVIICESCTFNTVFHKRHQTTCPNCRANINLKDLIYINKEINLDELIKNVEETNIFKEKEVDPAAIESNIEIKNPEYNKYEAIVDIVNGKNIPNREEVNVVIPQLMMGSAKLPDATKRKVLIFANYDETLRKIRDKFQDEKIEYEQLGGTYRQIADAVERFQTSDKHNVLLICAARYCAGLNLQMATDLVFAHLMIDENVETQVAGRLIRLGRTINANFHYIMFENEYAQKMSSGRMFKIKK